LLSEKPTEGTPLNFNLNLNLEQVAKKVKNHLTVELRQWIYDDFNYFIKDHAVDCLSPVSDGLNQALFVKKKTELV